MLRILKLLFLGLLFLNLNPQQGFTQSAEKSLEQMVSDLKFNPANDTLRKQVISKALSQTPPPVPEEAERRFFRGMAAMKNASSQTGFKNAASEFEKAITAAPWYADAYYNAGVAHNKAGNFAAAKNNFGFYLLAAPNAPDTTEVKALVYENEYLAEQEEKRQSEQRQAKAEQARLDRLVQPFKGVWNFKTCFGKNQSRNQCNEKEYLGSYWRVLSKTFFSGFEFPGDGSIIAKAPIECGTIHGFPDGNNIRNTLWECWSKDGQPRELWSITGADYIYLSGDRPVNESRFNPKTRYTYGYWKKQ